MTVVEIPTETPPMSEDEIQERKEAAAYQQMLRIQTEGVLLGLNVRNFDFDIPNHYQWYRRYVHLLNIMRRFEILPVEHVTQNLCPTGTTEFGWSVFQVLRKATRRAQFKRLIQDLFRKALRWSNKDPRNRFFNPRPEIIYPQLQVEFVNNHRYFFKLTGSIVRQVSYETMKIFMKLLEVQFNRFVTLERNVFILYPGIVEDHPEKPYPKGSRIHVFDQIYENDPTHQFKIDATKWINKTIQNP